MPIFTSTKYGYSSTRAKAMSSTLIGAQAMQSIIDAGSIDGALSILFQQQAYKDDIAKYGGTSIKRELIDFALSRNLAIGVNKLVTIAPKAQKNIMRALVGKWEIQNIRLAIEAKERKMEFEKIAPNIIEMAIGSSAIKEAMREQTVEGMLSRLAINSPYSKIIKAAAVAYSKNKNATEAIAALDVGYYANLSGVIEKIEKEHKPSAHIIRMEIDSKNILTMIRGKRIAMKFQALSQYLISNGTIKLKELEHIYESTHTVEEMAHRITRFDLKESIEAYKRTGQLVSFEIGINNYILNKGLAMLRVSILSFGTMIDYMYLKELEVRTLRIAINSKIYGLAPQEVSRLIAWKK